MNLAGKNYKILERKSSKFGSVGFVTYGNELEKRWTTQPQIYYDNLKREEIYRTAIDLYTHDQLVRPIINLIVNAIFKEPPDFQGDEELVKLAKQVIRDSEINWNSWGADLEVNGDLFLRRFFENRHLIASIPPETMIADYNSNNILNIKRYVQINDNSFKISSQLTDPLPNGAIEIPTNQVSHIKINNTSNMVYGVSTLRPAFWWIDVLDNLWERNWIRASQYYGSPIVVITGVPGDYQATVKASLETDGQRPGRNWIFPENVKAETLDFTKNYPIENLVDRVYQYILSSCNIPQHLIYETDSSRGVAMFSGDSFEMMIKARQRIWELGLIRIFRLIFEEEGIWKDDSKFKVGWSPLFQRDIKDLSNLIQTAMENKLFSKRTARERLGVDHSEELERFEQEKKDEPDELANAQIQKLMAPPAKTKDSI